MAITCIGVLKVHCIRCNHCLVPIEYDGFPVLGINLQNDNTSLDIPKHSPFTPGCGNQYDVGKVSMEQIFPPADTGQ